MKIYAARFFVVTALALFAASDSGAAEYCPYRLVTFKAGGETARFGLAQGPAVRPRLAIDVPPLFDLAAGGGLDRGAFFSQNLNRTLSDIQCRIGANPEAFAAYRVGLAAGTNAPPRPQPRNVVAM